MKRKKISKEDATVIDIYPKGKGCPNALEKDKTFL